jgi:hypothetical protein
MTITKEGLLGTIKGSHLYPGEESSYHVQTNVRSCKKEYELMPQCT